MSKENNLNMSVPVKLMYGGVAGAVAQTITYPLDVIRRRMQTAIDSVNMLTLVKTIYKKEGLSGFYRGMLPNYLKVVPAIAVSFVTFEAVRGLL